MRDKILLFIQLLKPFCSYLIAFFPFFYYLIMVQIVGEMHPFSKFPMYSSFPNHADYYYVADENNNPISTYKLLGITIDELKDMITVRAAKYNIQQNDEYGLRTVAMECLTELKKKIPPNTNLRELKWVKHKFYGDVNHIEEQKIILATCNLN